ncbi:MAG: putative adipose-regulatory protein-domain-containing protein [Benjaminiella poitrasii]|nr:MAG: putative adipose-regulatory protein-domain-containing protein [Benjaminiella poitrasii]
MPLRDDSSELDDTLSDIPENTDNFHVVPSGDEDSPIATATDVINDDDYIPEIPDMDDQPTRQPTHPLVLLLTRMLKVLLLPVCRLFFAPAAQRTFVKTTVLFVSLSWITVTSLVAYVTFYQRYIPPIMHAQPIWFQYRMEQGPVAIMDLVGSNKKPTSLRHEQVYDISVQLNVPTSDINFNIGNFMVQLDLYDSDDSVILQSNRPSILRYQSRTQRIMRVFAKAIPLLIGLTEEHQVLNIKLVDDYMEQKSKALNKISVSISDPRIQIYDAKLLILANFKGLRYYMYFHKISTGTLFMCMFASIEFICAAIAWKMFGEAMWHKLSQFIPEIEKQQPQQPELATSIHEEGDSSSLLHLSGSDAASSDKSEQ